MMRLMVNSLCFFVIQKDNRKGSVFAIRRRMLEEENTANVGNSLRKLGGGTKSFRPWTKPPLLT